MKVDGIDNSTNRYYLRKYQYAFGLQVTGTLSKETLYYIKKQNNCPEITNETNSRSILYNFFFNKDQLIFGLLRDFIYSSSSYSSSSNIFYNNNVTVTVAPGWE